MTPVEMFLKQIEEYKKNNLSDGVLDIEMLIGLISRIDGFIKKPSITGGCYFCGTPNVTNINLLLSTGEKVEGKVYKNGFVCGICNKRMENLKEQYPKLKKIGKYVDELSVEPFLKLKFTHFLRSVIERAENSIESFNLWKGGDSIGE